MASKQIGVDENAMAHVDELNRVGKLSIVTKVRMPYKPLRKPEVSIRLLEYEHKDIKTIADLFIVPFNAVLSCVVVIGWNVEGKQRPWSPELSLVKGLEVLTDWAVSDPLTTKVVLERFRRKRGRPNKTRH